MRPILLAIMAFIGCGILVSSSAVAAPSPQVAAGRPGRHSLSPSAIGAATVGITTAPKRMSWWYQLLLSPPLPSWFREAHR